jgi:hypothetical protein
MNLPALPRGHCALDDLGVLEVNGADATTFLQGQLSQDVTKLDARARFAGLHNPQGRTLAILRLTGTDDGAIRAVLPLDVLAATLAHLQKYVLRAKVTLRDASADWRVFGVSQELRFVRLVPRAAPLVASIPRDAWRAADIAEGLPQVYATNAAAFVAQMLNLDCVGGIAFDKGCYTGQEIIARAHYRGRVKRRMQRFVTREPLPLAALPIGHEGTLDDGRAFRIVDRVARGDGRVEFLAVAPLAAGVREAESGSPLAVEALPLPYSLPD